MSNSNVPMPPDHPGATRLWTVLRILNVRLRFIALMVLVGLIVGNWEGIMNRVDRWIRPAGAVAGGVSRIEYFCPMHPNVVRPTPDSCPICGMPLSKRTASGRSVPPAGVLARVSLTPYQVRLGRIGTRPIEYRLLGREVRAVGAIDYDETRVAHASARVKGWLEHLHVAYTGQRIRRGQPLYTIYSPDLLIAQEELLAARRALDRSTGPGASAVADQAMFEAARRKLRLWEITDEQIDELLRRGKAETRMTIVSPFTGIVTEKPARMGHFVNAGETIYTIADLAVVWMQARVFEDEIAGVKIGTAVEVASTAYPNEVFAGRITFIAYNVDPQTRTVAARVEIANANYKLKPGMYAMATIHLPAGSVVELGGVAASQAGGATSAATTRPTSPFIEAYLQLAYAYARDRTDAEALNALGAAAKLLPAAPPGSQPAEAPGLADLIGSLRGKSVNAQREAFKTVSKRTLELLRSTPAADRTLYVIHCPMADADWIQDSRDVLNPFYGSAMLRCGQVVGTIQPSAGRDEQRYAVGYYCPIYPDRLFAAPQHCPVDNFPTRLVRIEKVLAVPESAVINTGTRQVVYRESEPGVFDMVEVRLGPRCGDAYPVLSGLRPGDRVATAGAFLVDAENRLNPAGSVQFFGAGGGPQSGNRAN